MAKSMKIGGFSLFSKAFAVFRSNMIKWLAYEDKKTAI